MRRCCAGHCTPAAEKCNGVERRGLVDGGRSPPEDCGFQKFIFNPYCHWSPQLVYSGKTGNGKSTHSGIFSAEFDLKGSSGCKTVLECLSKSQLLVFNPTGVKDFFMETTFLGWRSSLALVGACPLDRRLKSFANDDGP